MEEAAAANGFPNADVAIAKWIEAGFDIQEIAARLHVPLHIVGERIDRDDYMISTPYGHFVNPFPIQYRLTDEDRIAMAVSLQDYQLLVEEEATRALAALKSERTHVCAACGNNYERNLEHSVAPLLTIVEICAETKDRPKRSVGT